MNNTGKGFEDAIEFQCILYEKQGTAKIHRTAIPSRYVYNGKVLALRPIPDRGNEERPNPWLDFAGVISGSGQSILIECKDVARNHLPVNIKGGITATEVQSIKEWLAADAMVLLLWFRNGECRKRALCVEDMDTKSISWDLMEEIDGYKFLG